MKILDAIRRYFSKSKPAQNLPVVPTSQEALGMIRAEIFRQKLTFQQPSADILALEQVRDRLAFIEEILQAIGTDAKGRKQIQTEQARLKFKEMQIEMRLGILGPQGDENEAGA